MFDTERSKLTGLVITLLLLGGVVAWTVMQKARYETEARDELIAVIATVDAYPDNQDVFDPIVENAHDIAFDAAYRWRLPGRRSTRDPAFRPDVYRQHAYVEIIHALKTAGYEDLALSVERARARSAQ